MLIGFLACFLRENLKLDDWGEGRDLGELGEQEAYDQNIFKLKKALSSFLLQ